MRIGEVCCRNFEAALCLLRIRVLRFRPNNEDGLLLLWNGSPRPTKSDSRAIFCPSRFDGDGATAAGCFGSDSSRGKRRPSSVLMCESNEMEPRCCLAACSIGDSISALGKPFSKELLRGTSCLLCGTPIGGVEELCVSGGGDWYDDRRCCCAYERSRSLSS